jgi:hypothetical protein
MDFRDI